MPDRRVISLALVALFLLPVVTLAQARVDPGARELLAYRLTLGTIARLRQIMFAMDGYRAPSPEALRPDVAMIGVLAMAGPFGEAFTDEQMTRTVDVLDRSHQELARVISQTGLSSREYVLGWTTLLAAHPVVATQRSTGHFVDSGVALENIEFVERNWSEVDRFVNEVGARIQRTRPGN